MFTAMRKASEHYKLNAAQQHAVFSTFSRFLSLIQGPPGTGKTTTAAAILHANHELFPRVQVCAASNMAVDELLMRLVKADVSVYRYGALSSISNEDLKILQEHALEEIVDDQLNLSKKQ